MKYFFGIIAFTFFLLPIALMAQVDSIYAGTVHRIYSEILNEERNYQISLPDSYTQDDFYIDKSYPVLVLLDGGSHFLAVSSLLKSMSSDIHGNERIPEMIVLGIPNIVGSRNRDFTPTKTTRGPNGEENASLGNSGQSDRFAQFLEKELLPKIDRTYRTLDYKVLIGHSLAGLFALNSMFQEDEFKAYIAIDPSLWWQDQYLVKKANEILAKNSLSKTRLYLSKSNNPFNEDPEISAQGKDIQSFLGALNQFSAKKLSYRYQFFESEDHFSIPMISIYHGLLFIFEGYNFPLKQLKKAKAGAFKQHYEAFSKSMDCPIPPPGKWLDFVGNYLLQQGDVDLAIKLFEICTTFYPFSYVPYYSLGNAYLRKEAEKEAIQYFEKALEKAPENEAILSRIKDINQLLKEKK